MNNKRDTAQQLDTSVIPAVTLQEVAWICNLKENSRISCEICISISHSSNFRPFYRGNRKEESLTKETERVAKDNGTSFLLTLSLEFGTSLCTV